ncbi:hypothetical protein I6F40_12125 [Pseudoalteromonas sp. SWXJ133]|uniref:hypothetical protein n=1 Tax=Pseudoalteromonas sp. SWXJ133 TaxID=2792069 RepID=UPI0018CDB5BC|nr:hypothetical protein [Pseudoalteromonas sp. SWXJ133]MBH0021088.1 hypothetical protein [Pseudoalteromonas sp. SWXJ133]
MFKKFVQITALFNFPIALGMIISALMAPQADTLIITVVLGVSFMLMGAALLWATSDIKTRAPLIVWNGLVRMVGFIIVTYAASLGLAPKVFIFISVMDLITAFVYIIGSMRISGLSFKSLFLGKTQ